MSSVAPHPTLSTPVEEIHRERALTQLREAYDAGRLTPNEYDRRAGIAATAQDRRQLNSAFLGLIPPSQWRRPNEGRALATFAHLSSVFWVFGPLFCFSIAQPGSFARRESAKAFNFTFVTTVLMVGLMIAGVVLGWDVFGFAMGLVWLGWFFLTSVGALKAAQGIDWTNPVRSFVRWEVLSER